MIATRRTLHLVRRERGRKEVADAAPATSAVPAGRVPRISRLMALAIRFDRLLREGAVSDLSQIARLAHVSQPRMTQIMNLNLLAPDIQEELLFLPRIRSGRERIHERLLRPICALPSWAEQRRLWSRLRPSDSRLSRSGGRISTLELLG